MLDMTLDDFNRVYICLSIYATRKHKEQAVWKKFTFKILVPYISHEFTRHRDQNRVLRNNSGETPRVTFIPNSCSLSLGAALGIISRGELVNRCNEVAIVSKKLAM